MTLSFPDIIAFAFVVLGIGLLVSAIRERHSQSYEPEIFKKLLPIGSTLMILGFLLIVIPRAEFLKLRLNAGEVEVEVEYKRHIATEDEIKTGE